MNLKRSLLIGWVENTLYFVIQDHPNLLMLSALNQKLDFNLKSVVVPSVAWATDLPPVMELGFKPILCDSNKIDLSVDLEHLERIFIEENPSALLLVSVLGFCPNMKRITELCDEHGVILLEDACESLGSEFREKKLGTFGVMSSFSTYFGHHISTIEGGVITTDDKDLYDILVSIRRVGVEIGIHKHNLTLNKIGT